jgi:dTMP kinase
VFLSLSSDVAAKRGGYGEERYEKEEMQRKVREIFTKLQNDPRDEGDWYVIDASGTVEQVSDQIWEVIDPLLDTSSNYPIRSIL